MRRHFEKGLAAETDSTGCADCTCSITFGSITSVLTCINQTIYCLLIQPNPDSALNATAGHLLQDDYDSFARQARLMTSIHAGIPFDQKEAVLEAKRRGETADTAIGEDAEHRPIMKRKYASSSSTVVIEERPGRITSTQSEPSHPHQTLEGAGAASEDEDDKSVSKENDPLLSPYPVPNPDARPSSLAKPLSELPIVETEYDVTDAPCLSPSEPNVVNNVNLLVGIAASDSPRKGLQLAESSQNVNMTGRGLQETGGNGVGSVGLEGRPPKRICSDSGKENTLEIWEARKLIEKPLPTASAATKVGVPHSRRASASSSSGTSSVKMKSRVGLRRL